MDTTDDHVVVNVSEEEQEVRNDEKNLLRLEVTARLLMYSIAVQVCDHCDAVQIALQLLQI